MSLRIPNEGLAALLAAGLGSEAASTPLTLRLFSNNKTPATTDTSASYTQVAGAGYAAVPLTAASWVLSSAAALMSAVYPTVQFVFTGATDAPGTIYGWYITDADDDVIGAERLASPPFTPTLNGDSIDVDLVFTFRAETS